MYLQLAEGSVKQKIAEFYIPYPDKQGNPVLVREDFLDDLSDEEYENYMDTLEEAGVNIGGKRREERKKRREERKEEKRKKKEAKTQIKLSRAEAIKSGGTFGSRLLDTAGNVVSGIFGGDDSESKVSGSVEFGTPTTEEKKPPYLLYGIGAVLILGTVYFLTRPKAKVRVRR